jgi:GT2 family glycosyltransferase
LDVLAGKEIRFPIAAACDIIVPTYNNEALTIACFESIKRCTSDYRIIWVDNGSKDTAAVEKSLEGMNYLAIKLPKNEGFVGAVNRGIMASNAKTVCLLNNDTEVSPRWLDKLTAMLYSKNEYGIVGSLTGPPAQEQQFDSHHNIAYQQRFRKIPIFPEWVGLADFNLKIEKQLPGMIGQVDFVAFLCAAIKREVIDKVGLLDANYAMGMWDDADYNFAAHKAGYKTVLALDTCIIHKGRSTFKIIQENEKFDVDALLKKNRAYLESKWGQK